MRLIIISNKKSPDVGGDVCCEYILLPLVNKEAVFSQWLNRVKSGRKSKQREEERMRSQGEAM